MRSRSSARVAVMEGWRFRWGDVSNGSMETWGARKHTFFSHCRISCSVQSSGSAVVSTAVGGGILENEDGWTSESRMMSSDRDGGVSGAGQGQGKEDQRAMRRAYFRWDQAGLGTCHCPIWTTRLLL